MYVMKASHEFFEKSKESAYEKETNEGNKRPAPSPGIPGKGGML